MRIFRLILVAAVISAPLRAQSAGDAALAESLSRWIALTAPPGSEELATVPLMKALPG